jgi:hypothetical protein
MMDLLISPNFLLGLFGALVTLYLAKQVVIPELRPLFDTTDTEKESKSLEVLTANARQRIDAVLSQMATDSQHSADLQRQLDGLQSSLKLNQKRLAVVERRLLLSQVMSRGSGFILFVILGGVVANLLTGTARVTVTGFQGTLPPGIQAFAIGASWIGFLSLVGIRNIQESASTQVDAVKDSTVQQLNDLKSKLDGLVRPGVSQGPIMVPFSAQADLSKEISERFDSTLREVSAGFNNAKVRIREDARRVF